MSADVDAARRERNACAECGHGVMDPLHSRWSSGYHPWVSMPPVKVTTVDAALEALLALARSDGPFAQRVEAFEATIRAEYAANLRRLTEANLAYGAEINRQMQELAALRAVADAAEAFVSYNPYAAGQKRLQAALAALAATSAEEER